jgi:O-antigen/teichoic acid export membrane protein
MANWVGYGVNLAVMFFLSPFVVHSLGDSAYGVWSLLVSLTGYMGLVELGTRGGLDRFINYHLGRDDVSSVNGVINTGLLIFVVCGLGLMMVSGGVAFFFDTFFTKTPAELVGVAKLTVLLVAVNLWLAFLGTPFYQVLTAFERFDVVNAINLVVLGIRTALIVWVLRSGGGIISLAVVQAVATAIGLVAAAILAKRIFPPLRINFGLASRDHFRQLFTFSFWGFVTNIAMQLLYWTDNVVIAVLLGPEMVTYYAIGSMLIIYSRGVVGQCSAIFTPQIIKYVAREDWASLRKLFLQGSNLIMAVGILLLVGIMAFGQEFLTLWMGPEYGEKSYGVLLILGLSQLPAMAILLGSPVILGLNKVRFGATVTLVQAIINLVLSVILVEYFQMGIDGVAWGTFYPRIVFALLVHYLVLRWIGLPGWVFLRNIVLRWIVSALAFGMICFVVIRIGSGQVGWNLFLLKAGLATVIYIPLSWFGLLTKQERAYLEESLKTTLGKVRFWSRARCR